MKRKENIDVKYPWSVKPNVVLFMLITQIFFKLLYHYSSYGVWKNSDQGQNFPISVKISPLNPHLAMNKWLNF